MKTIKKIFSVLRNKYIIALVVFAVILLFFDQNDIFVQLGRKHQLEALQAKKKFYEDEITETQKELAELKGGPAAIEKYGREHYYMKRPNEDVFIVIDPSDTTK